MGQVNKKYHMLKSQTLSQNYNHTHNLSGKTLEDINDDGETARQ